MHTVTDNKWCLAEIVNIGADGRLLVHCARSPSFRAAFTSASAVIGWDARWDELMTRDSPRIAPCACKSATLPPVFDIFSRSPRTHTKDLGDTGDRAFALLIFRVFSWTFLAARRPGAAVGAGVGGELAAFQALCTCLFAFAFFL